MPCRLLISFLAISSAAFAQPGAPPAPVTQVMATLTVKAGVARDRIMTVMSDEVEATVRLYLDGKIQQWYARADGKGVVFILNSSSVGDAKSVLDTLPLIKSGFAEFDYMPLTPLTPLRILLTDQNKAEPAK